MYKFCFVFSLNFLLFIRERTLKQLFIQQLRRLERLEHCWKASEEEQLRTLEKIITDSNLNMAVVNLAHPIENF